MIKFLLTAAIGLIVLTFLMFIAFLFDFILPALGLAAVAIIMVIYLYCIGRVISDILKIKI